MSKNSKYYVVWNGHNPGVYDNWDDCKEQVINYPNPIYKSFSSPQSAAQAYREGFAKNDSKDLANLISGVSKHREHTGAPADYFDNPEIDLKAWAVDAACAGNPGPVEYRGVELMTGKELFRIGPLEGGTNNLGEFLAIVHALALMDKMGESHPIYSDSVSGMAWVRNKVIKTTLKENDKNARLFDMLRRALNWLNTHTYSARIMKWDTPRWGEIPADFGRK
ncbi:MAG: ribonuclease H family protein [Muribaculaceae bacterium]|nr:ribonuclease H family protein [Muribaculaceae bacterium]